MINKNTNDIDQHHQDLMNKAAGSVISKYIFQIKKYKIDPTKPRQNPNKLFFANSNYALISYWFTTSPQGIQGPIGPNGTYGQPGPNITNGTNLDYNIGNNTGLPF